MTPVSVKKIATLTGHKSSVYALCRSQYSNIFFSAGGDGFIVKWDQKEPETGVLVAQMPNSIYTITYDPDNDLLISGHNYDGVHFFDWQANKEVGSLRFTDQAMFTLGCHKGLLYVGTAGGELCVINVEGRSLIQRLKLSDKSVRSIAINDRSGEIAVALSDNSIRVHDLASLKEKYNWQAHDNSVFDVKFDHTNTRLLSVGRDARLKSWDALDSYQIQKEVVAHLYSIHHVDFSPDNKHFVTCSMDKTIKLWDAEKLDLLKVVDRDRYDGHRSSINKVVWSEYENQIVSASDDRTISLWKFDFHLV